MSHALIRTSPKGSGTAFLGRCSKCGEEGLRMSDALKPCPADHLVSDEAALLDALTVPGPCTICEGSGSVATTAKDQDGEAIEAACPACQSPTGGTIEDAARLVPIPETERSREHG